MDPATAVLRCPPALKLMITLPAALGVGLVMASADSLWIDELQTLHCAESSSLGASLTAAATSGQSEAQMIGYIAYAWAWEKLLGQSEWSLRLSNVPWLLLAVGALARVGRRLELPALWVVFLVQPFLWYYVGELRPYAMQIAGGSLAVWAITEYVGRRGLGAGWAVGLMAAALVVSLASMLGVVTAAALFGVLLVVGRRRRWGPEPRAIGVLLGGLLLLGALGSYYAWTLSQGAGGAKHWGVSPANIAFAFYEFLGFSGFGLPRDMMREAAQGGLGELARQMTPYLPGLTLLGLGYAALFSAALAARDDHQAPNGRSQTTPADDAAAVAGISLAVLIATVLLLVALAYAASWPFWGRHLAPVFPCWVFLLAWLLRRVGARSWGKAIGMLLLGLLLASSLVLRFSTAHAKDDYRGAAQLARHAVQQGDAVWWVASRLEQTTFYGAFFREHAPPSRWTPLHNPTPEALAALPAPDVVFVSKPDIYDSDGLVRTYLIANGLEAQHTLKAFQVWGRVGRGL